MNSLNYCLGGDNCMVGQEEPHHLLNQEQTHEGGGSVSRPFHVAFNFHRSGVSSRSPGCSVRPLHWRASYSPSAKKFTNKKLNLSVQLIKSAHQPVNVT